MQMPHRGSLLSCQWRQYLGVFDCSSFTYSPVPSEALPDSDLLDELSIVLNSHAFYTTKGVQSTVYDRRRALEKTHFFAFVPVAFIVVTAMRKILHDNRGHKYKCVEGIKWWADANSG